MISRAALNPRVLDAEYAVRGPIVQRAQQLERQGKQIIYCNIGNPQALGQRPLTYLRQVLSLIEYPELLDAPATRALYPGDIIKRARLILAQQPPGTGAYTQSPGLPFVRQAVADFISRRDGIPADPDHILLTDGASKAAQAVLQALIAKPDQGFMIPIPQYPLYSATLTLLGGQQIGYHLDEGNGWQLNEQILESSFTAARRARQNAVGIVVINPGNPTGAVLTQDNIEMIIGFAHRRGLAIIADEVYQENVYRPGSRFHSFARVLTDLAEREVTLFSLHSVSKGLLGECGHRGGYLEIRNAPVDVLAEFVKLQSISLCANVPGQLATYLMVAPPQRGEASYHRYQLERDAIFEDLRAKAEALGAAVNAIPGMQVEIPAGAMYAFVRIELPVAGHRTKSRSGDALAEATAREASYCMALLEKTGICVVPGSGFGQQPGTLHFRTTFLPPRDQIQALVDRLGRFHQSYLRSQKSALPRLRRSARSDATGCR
ncbi:MAG: aminotransferase class I/II-fold pyridoxal phosphate-dependent enzyme [Deltaproteobacteria bacterium]|nr:aminotransferase class I/II-fold pyridoxal phosphate-dependent enzyme [Deltaproteobacteria bacterium]